MLRDRDWILSQSTGVQFPAKTLKSSMQQIRLVWLLQKVLRIRHGLTPFSTSGREVVKTNTRSNPVTFFSSLKTTTSRHKYFISSEKATKNQSTFKCSRFCIFCVSVFLSSQVFEQYVGRYEPKAPSFRVFDPHDSLSNLVQSQWI